MFLIFRKSMFYIFYLVLLLGLAELLTRSFFPEFVGGIWVPHETDKQGVTHYKVHNKNLHRARVDGISRRVQLPFQPSDYRIKGKEVVLVVGDSITEGYGNSYENVWWAAANRRLKLEYESPPEILPISGIGGNLDNMMTNLDRHLRNIRGLTKRVRAVVYQFNMNDINPYGSKTLKALGTAGSPNGKNGTSEPAVQFDTGMVPASVKREFEILKGKYLNHSAFVRLLGHYAHRFTRSAGSSCEQRGLGALGQYSWAWGSKPFSSQANRLWQHFEQTVSQLDRDLKSAGIGFYIFVTPTVYDIDKEGDHIYAHKRNGYDFSCATIDPAEKLSELSARRGINVVNPTAYMRDIYLAKKASGNWQRFYFLNDDNHLNEAGSHYFSEYFYGKILKQIVAAP